MVWINNTRGSVLIALDGSRESSLRGDESGVRTSPHIQAMLQTLPSATAEALAWDVAGAAGGKRPRQQLHMPSLRV